MPMLLRSALAGLLLLMTACEDAGLAAVNIPTRLAEVEETFNTTFDPVEKLALDIYRPSGDPAGKLPVIIFFYGGSWQTGARAEYRFVGSEMAAKGFITVIPDYRKSPAHRFPAFAEDGAKAVAWVMDNLDALGGGDVYLMGHSAGAHIAATLAVNPEFLAAHDLAPKQLAGVIGLAGPYDFTPRDDDIVAVFVGAPTSATHLAGQVTRDVPPMLLQWGEADDLVGPQNHERLAAALAKNNVCYQVKTYEGLGHIDLISAFSWIYRDHRPVRDETVAFLRDGCPYQ
ncbi:MAG: alpha/beta hydrolase [Alphaproteobacteria bacterium]|nr:alpha/beta hydrolase [Alphaproteobacteria bacterium SS10]